MQLYKTNLPLLTGLAIASAAFGQWWLAGGITLVVGGTGLYLRVKYRPV